MTTLVLLPGLDGTGELFDPLLRELPAGWRTWVARYPADAALGYDELTRRLQASLPADEPLVLLGESFSGPVAIKLAAALGIRVQALVLCCSFARNPRPALSRFANLVNGLPSPGAMPLRWAAPLLLGRGSSPDLRARLAQALAQLPAAVMRSRLKMVLQADVLPELAGLQMPVLYLQAAQDLVVPASAAAEVRRTLPGTRLVRLAGPHGLLQAEPAAAAQVLESFLGPFLMAFHTPGC